MKGNTRCQTWVEVHYVSASWWNDGAIEREGADQAGAQHEADATLPAGGNTARFRMKIDNNSADNNVQVTIDVRDSSTGTTLGTRDVRRQEFTVAGDWVTFPVPFTLPSSRT